MEMNSKRIQELIEQPGESLAVELKTWINPDQPDGIAKIVKTVLALRNHGGGYMVIGLNDETLKPDFDKAPVDVDVRVSFHIDTIQGIISKYSSEPFEVTVEYPQYEGQEFPVIVIPSGVITPVAAKSELCSTDGKILIKSDCVYVRSLSANNTPSTTQATWKDWQRIVEICFDNREADIGRFIRRQLGSLTPDHLHLLASVINQGSQTEPSTEDLLKAYIHESEGRYESVIKERSITLAEFGTWEVALIVVGEVPKHSANQDFLNLLSANNPRYTGWPVWLDARRLAQPYIFNGVWEAFIAILDLSWSKSVDFMRLNPKGRFYLKRALEDDLSTSKRAPKPMTTLDFGLAVFRTAEAIAVGLEFAKAMGCEPEKTTLTFAFKWSGLRDRYLSSWAQPGRFLPERCSAYQNEVFTFVDVPLETPASALAQYVNQATQPLFQVFDGFVLDDVVVEDLTRRLIERRF